MPEIVFTDPEVAHIGLTEAQARAAGHAVRSTTLPLDQLPRALAARDTRGFLKLVAEEESLRLLGAHILPRPARTRSRWPCSRSSTD